MTTASFRILVAVDFRPPSWCSLDHALAWASRARCDLHLLHVAPAGAASGVLAHDFVELARLAGERLRRTGSEHAVVFERHVAEGAAPAAIVAAAERLAADLVILCAGEVADQVRRKARCPVMAVAAGGPPPPVRRVVCPVDLAPCSRCAAFTAARIARFFGAELVLLHVLPDSGAADALERQLAGWRGDLELAGELELRTAVARGEAAREVVSRLATDDGELLVIAGHAGDGPEARLAEELAAAAGCPVVAVPPLEPTRGVSGVRFGAGTALVVVEEAPSFEDDVATVVRPVNALVRRAVAEGALVVYREDGGELPPGLRVCGPVLRGDAPDEIARFLCERHVARVVLVGIPRHDVLVDAIAAEARRLGCAAELA